MADTIKATDVANVPAASAFPAVKAIAGPTSRTRGGKPNPAVEPVKAALGKGWQAIPVNADTVEGFRSQVTRAGKSLGLKVKTRTDNPAKPTQLEFLVTQHASE